MPATEEQRTALARAALAEVTNPAEVGAVLAVETIAPGVVDVRFACTLAAYAGWHWTVSTADLPDLPDLEPTVLELGLLPGAGALLAPPWVPWTERLAEWRRQHPDEPHPEESPADGDDVEPDEDADLDDSDLDDADLDEDDLAVDDDLVELDETELDDPRG